MAEFHLPYQFIPVDGQPKATAAWDDEQKPWQNAPHAGVRHDLWVDGTCSGRIVCRLKLKSPTFVGGTHGEGAPTPVEHYQRNGDCAIPANSLRGMVAAIAEALSQSALRLLEKRPYSVRRPMKPTHGIAPLSAVGCLRRGTGNRWWIEPLTLPVLGEKNGRFMLGEPWAEVFAGLPLRECLSAYVNGYREHPNDSNRLAFVPGSFLAGKPVSDRVREETVPWFGRPRVQAGLQVERDGIAANVAHLKIKNGKFLIGQSLNGDPARDRGEGMIPGYLRVLGIEGREGHLPVPQNGKFGKKHELFVPRPSRARPRLPIPDEVMNVFREMVRERAADQHEGRPSLPFFPAGYQNMALSAEQIEGKQDWFPMPDTLVFFDLDGTRDEAGRHQVSAISYSSIWRRGVEGDSHAFFKKLGVDTRPWGAEGRTGLTPAELLFGVVEDRDLAPGDRDRKKQPARNLASRLRFADALPQLEAGQQVARLPSKTLKILSSPKPPSPALYFHPENQRGTYVSKHGLTVEKHRPNGRKVYLHHPETQIDAEWWWSCAPDKHQDQKVKIAPMKAGQFWFHIDFDNLSDRELTLLLTALEPGPSFVHRLGMGKPLGLGSVKLEVAGLFLVDRRARYAALDDGERPRYAQTYRGLEEDAWHGRYQREQDALDGTPLDSWTRDPAYVDDRTRAALNTVGDPARLKNGSLVHTPLTASQQSQDSSETTDQAEEETFKWFVENDDGKHYQQALRPITPGRPLPTLRPPRSKPSNQNGRRRNGRQR